VVGLEMGSDDYISKPFLPRELVIRVKRILTRVYGSSIAPFDSNQVVCIPPYIIDEQSRFVQKEDASCIDLTSKEFDLLLYLTKNRGQPLDREQIIGQVWGMDYFGSDRVVDDLVRRIRRKMPELRIETMYGYGYRMVKL
jgi:two-component system response regulator CssR